MRIDSQGVETGAARKTSRLSEPAGSILIIAVFSAQRILPTIRLFSKISKSQPVLVQNFLPRAGKAWQPFLKEN